ncbi:L,D-peptidoglycan transpeptidase YkuD, ErfK/YbiS/YcfS/YnhG family [Nitratireductor aquibiodomus]|uniref:L,D-peptidoglycan transpeptidase YkuD, ErfK/YbiS/YcfS/YnhG family n=2 Tax=Nitratireductor aquibiodomus TaxID=204799 RepID=A0A1H4KA31_9HYPH|nr:L,D-transpeptidase family protein [Nitratireductor aquibiodomus]SEB55389.1 L,D-peptidoglycan transpeptidase YkuD, ErfK/YbiS/YcfS/YnhG family [Nitratireductor aquibiodomus]
MKCKAGKSIGLIEVRRRPGRPTQGLLSVGPLVFPCALGRTGTTMLKREGDGATPVGDLLLLYGYFRGDRAPAGPPLSRFPLTRIDARDGWCDASGDRNYNRPVRLPYPASHERMAREDRLYDVCMVSDWNMRPAIRNRGSAIFFHIAKPGFPPTEGCIAVSPLAMARILPLIGPHTRIRIYR